MKKIENIFWAIVSCIVTYSSDTSAIITEQNTLQCNCLYPVALEAHAMKLIRQTLLSQEG
jgi:hypothetical protein